MFFRNIIMTALSTELTHCGVLLRVRDNKTFMDISVESELSGQRRDRCQEMHGDPQWRSGDIDRVSALTTPLNYNYYNSLSSVPPQCCRFMLFLAD